MPQLIDGSYFDGVEIPVPNQDSFENSLDDVILRFETECLENALGYTLNKEFQAAVEAGGSLEQRWDDLLNGVEFSFELNGNTINTKWIGLVNDEKVSVLAFYVWYYWKSITLTSTTSIGEAQGLAENVDMVSAKRKMADAWRKMLKLYGDFADIQNRHFGRVYYPDFHRCYFDKYKVDRYQHYNDAPSLYNFLLANKDDYTGWVFSPLGRINQFGI